MKQLNATVMNLPGKVHALSHALGSVIEADDYARLRALITPEVDIEALHHILDTALALCRRVAPDRSMALAIILEGLRRQNAITAEEVRQQWGDDIGSLVEGLQRIDALQGKSTAVENENFGKLLMALGQDIRVIIIMIVERHTLMLNINHHPDQEWVKRVAAESRYLYAPLAHRLGLYAIKGDLEDLWLKYTDRDIYTAIARKLNQTKVARDAYIAAFIAPVKARLEAHGLHFDIKGRTKSIYSIWNKIQRQRTDIDHIYDLFAIRIILDTPTEREKPDCWLAYSVVTDMYRPNPARMKDWISIPKSNGYESLHITVSGPESRWVEVQIRTRRMDLVAEKGLAAHWRYKGIKGDNQLDGWMNNVRDILEAGTSGPGELMRGLKMDMYQREVFVFTPKGDLYRLPEGATLLDFAFLIHTSLGCRCIGGRVNGKNQRLGYRLRSGDEVEINTSSTQTPKRDWLSIVVTSKARSKVRTALNEAERHQADLGRELMERRVKNRKIQIDEALMARLMKRLGYKTSTEFYCSIGEGTLDPGRLLDQYTTLVDEETATDTDTARQTAEGFVLNTETPDNAEDASGGDVIVIGEGIKGVNYRMSRCCNPIYGDEVFGFVASEGVIKIHRQDCPNAPELRRRYPYRIIRTRWSGKASTQFPATLEVVGRDDIGIVTNISSIINKQPDVSLRNISISSQDGTFRGTLVVGIPNTEAVTLLIKKLTTIKGIKNVTRIR